MTDIFLSYSSKDREWARRLANKLASIGFSVWWDRTIPAGKSFSEVITEALDGARCVVVVWSEHSIKSNWVREEAEEGRKRDILVPVLMHVVSPPLGFRSIQAADLSVWDGEEDTRAVQNLVDDIALVVGLPKKPMPEKEPLAVEIGQDAPSPPPTISMPKEAEAAETGPADKVYRPIHLEQHSEIKITLYFILGVASALVAGLLVGTNHAFYWREFQGFSSPQFIAPSLYAFGLFSGLELSNRLPHRKPVMKMLTTVGVVVAVGVVLAVLPWSRSFHNLGITLLGWTGICIFVMVAIRKLKTSLIGMPSNRFWWAIVTGAIGGALWATLIGGVSHDFTILVSHDWLMLFADGIPLGAIIGFVESVGQFVRRKDIGEEQLTRCSS